MNWVNVVFFQASIAPEKLALVSQGSVIPYARFVQGVLSVQQRLAAIGLVEGNTVAVNVAHPIDHLVLVCALYRMKVASASVNRALDLYLDKVPFDAVLSDSVAPAINAKQPGARFILVDPSWFQDAVKYNFASRSSGRRDPNTGWISRINCVAAPDGQTAVVRTTSQALEGQLQTYCLSAPPDWERMVTVTGPHTSTGLLQALSALWLGRSVCFVDVPSVRSVTVNYKHHYLVASSEDVQALLTLQETHDIPMPSLRAAAFDGRGFNASALTRGLTTLSSNLLVRYAHPEAGIVAYGDAGRFHRIEGATGFVAPWMEVQVVDDRGTSVGPGIEGALRFRPRTGALDVGNKKSGEPGEWIVPRQRAKLMPGNLLVVRPQ